MQEEYTFSLRGIFFCADLNFEAKPSEVVGKKGDTSFDVSLGFKNKCAVIYIDNAEYIKGFFRREGSGSVAN